MLALRIHDLRSHRFELGDYVIDFTTKDAPDADPERVALLHHMCVEFGIGDDVHLLPGVGVDLEE